MLPQGPRGNIKKCENYNSWRTITALPVTQCRYKKTVRTPFLEQPVKTCQCQRVFLHTAAARQPTVVAKCKRTWVRDTICFRLRPRRLLQLTDYRPGRMDNSKLLEGRLLLTFKFSYFLVFFKKKHVFLFYELWFV